MDFSIFSIILCVLLVGLVWFKVFVISKIRKKFLLMIFNLVISIFIFLSTIINVFFAIPNALDSSFYHLYIYPEHNAYYIVPLMALCLIIGTLIMIAQDIKVLYHHKKR
ncbi:hypothetical protein [Brassicibacter mesophilus]|uniref:hypothetical protein n=1 Tax=Brassicibacter mesophilus TaxID=745119 RepID=UPI003D1C77B9